MIRETLHTYPGMLPDEDDLEPIETGADAIDADTVKPCLSCMAPNAEEAHRCVSCGAAFGIPSVVFPGRIQGPTLHRAVKPSKLKVFAIGILNVAFIGWNIAAIKNVLSGPINGLSAALLAVGGFFLLLCLLNLYRIVAAYRSLPGYWDGRE